MPESEGPFKLFLYMLGMLHRILTGKNSGKFALVIHYSRSDTYLIDDVETIYIPQKNLIFPLIWAEPLGWIVTATLGILNNPSAKKHQTQFEHILLLMTKNFASHVIIKLSTDCEGI